MDLILVDWIIIAVVIISTLISIISGFIKECLSLINWFLAFAIAKFFYDDLAQSTLFASMQPDFRIPVAILVLFLGAFLLGTVVVYMVIRIMRKTDGSLSITDRILGMCFGALRGVMVVCACLAVCNILFSLGLFSFIQKMPFWNESAFIPEFNKVVFWFFDKINVPEVIGDVVNNLGSSSSNLHFEPNLLNGSGDPASSTTVGIDPANVKVGDDGTVEIIAPQDSEQGK